MILSVIYKTRQLKTWEESILFKSTKNYEKHEFSAIPMIDNKQK